MAGTDGANGPRIVVGVDGSESSQKALAWAVRQARLTGGSIDAVIAWHYPAMGGYGLAASPEVYETDYRELAAKILNDTVSATPGTDGEVTIRQLVRHDSPAPALLEAASGADLLVVGSRGHGGFAGLLLGSVSQQCAHHAPCPIVIVRAHGP
jgi:nucleotide-binding universal stress UspA family protein